MRAFGTAGLLHDIGKVKIPTEILNKAGRLTTEERAIMNAHPVEGAKIIISSEEKLDLAAVVAYEHHIMINGGGYPKLEVRDYLVERSGSEFDAELATAFVKMMSEWEPQSTTVEEPVGEAPAAAPRPTY